MFGINSFNFQDKELLNKMTNIKGSRGPDFIGYTSHPEYSVSHNRLAIMDTHARANQPYLFENLIILFNVEIYNHLEIKKILEQNGYKFKTTSDTKVIIKLFKEYGIDLFKKLLGIFAISIYDKLPKKHYLIRDVLGVKLLYYYFNETKKKLGFNSPFAGRLRNEIYEFRKNVSSKDYYDFSEIIDLDWCQKLLKKYKEEHCDPYLIWNLISLEISLRKYKF